MDVKQCLILLQMYCKGLMFVMIEFFQFIEIHHLSIDRQKFNYKAFSENDLKCSSIKHDARWYVFKLKFL
jgi:hypothetical protein